MNIIQQPVMFYATSHDGHMALGISVAIAAIALLCLTITAARKKTGFPLPSRYLQASYWINRAKHRRWLTRYRAGEHTV